MDKDYFNFLGQNIDKEKKETAQEIPSVASVTVRADADCFLFCDGEYLDIQLEAGKFKKIQLPIGEHALEFLYTEEPDIKFEKEVNFPEAGKSYLINIKGLKAAVDSAVTEAKKEKEVEARKAEKEERERLLVEQKRLEEEKHQEQMRILLQQEEMHQEELRILRLQEEKRQEEIRIRQRKEEEKRQEELCIHQREEEKKRQEEMRIRALQPVPYAVLNTVNRTLTFYYDNMKYNRDGMDITPIAEESQAWGVKVRKRRWLEYKDVITTVVFDESFANCHSINDTGSWFYFLTELTTIQGLSNLHTENVTDMTCMFCECQSLEELDLSNFDTKNVFEMNHMFSGCKFLEHLDLSNFDTRNVSNMGFMFHRCKSLKEIKVSSFDTRRVKNMQYMFCDCESLQELDLSNFDTSKVIEMDGMFNRCTSLKELDIRHFNMKNVNRLTDFVMFGGMKKEIIKT
jgi:surface protein